MRSGFYQDNKNTMPNGIRKKTNIGKMERNGLMPPRFVFPLLNSKEMMSVEMDKEYVAILLLEAMCRDKEFHDSVLENVLRAKEKYIRKVQR